MRKKSHERSVASDTKAREEGGGGGWAATPFPHGLLGRQGGRKKQVKMSEFEPGKKRGKVKEASVLVLFLTIIFFY